MPFFAGLDWGGTRHAVCVIDATGAVLARAWVRILWRAWQDRSTYDPARHLAAAKIAA